MVCARAQSARFPTLVFARLSEASVVFPGFVAIACSGTQGVECWRDKTTSLFPWHLLSRLQMPVCLCPHSAYVYCTPELNKPWLRASHHTNPGNICHVSSSQPIRARECLTKTVEITEKGNVLVTRLFLQPILQWRCFH